MSSRFLLGDTYVALAQSIGGVVDSKCVSWLKTALAGFGEALETRVRA